MPNKEIAFVFDCNNRNLTGIIHQGKHTEQTGILIVVGGPQYRVGSHRQFVLLARALSEAGIPVMRFDYSGMGDSDGDFKSFLDIDEDISAAINVFYKHCPNLTDTVIWGLCDAASAALFYGYQDLRVKGLVLLNPWVYTEEGAAKTYIKHYYLKRLLNPEFWQKIFSFKFNYAESFISIFNLSKKILDKPKNQDQHKNNFIDADQKLIDKNIALPIRMKACFARFSYPILIILSGNDLTADEFREVTASDQEWRKLLNEDRVSLVTLPEADHTFSSSSWRIQVTQWTLEWIKSI